MQYLPLSVPIALLTEGILHANNSRDIKSDKEAGVITLPTLIGFQASYQIYTALLVLTYVSIPVLAFMFNMYGIFLCLLTAPQAVTLVNKFGSEIEMLDQETAQFHSMFGLAMLVGIMSGY